MVYYCFTMLYQHFSNPFTNQSPPDLTTAVASAFPSASWDNSQRGLAKSWTAELAKPFTPSRNVALIHLIQHVPLLIQKKVKSGCLLKGFCLDFRWCDDLQTPWFLFKRKFPWICRCQTLAVHGRVVLERLQLTRPRGEVANGEQVQETEGRGHSGQASPHQ